jgi:hypothetical protein
MKLTVWHTAYKHGLSEQEIRSAYYNAREAFFIDSENKDKKYYVGFGTDAVPIELVVVDTDQGPLIIHAMKPARKHITSRMGKGDTK